MTEHLALEPWLLQSTDEISTDPDGWTLRSADGFRGAHSEHTVTITADDAIVLTDRSLLDAPRRVDGRILPDRYHGPMQHPASAERDSAYELFQRGTQMLADRHFGASAVILERALTLEPGKASILEALGRAYYNLGSVTLAAERFGAIVDADPLAHYAHFGLGLARARLGDDRSARRHLRLAVRMQPDNEAYRQALARVDAAA